MQFLKVEREILKKLKSGLNPDYFYHSYEHTLDVIRAAKELGKAEHLTVHELTLVKTAALFHDAGYLVSYNNHEFYSSRMASEILPDYQYNKDEIGQIIEMIEATRLPQKPLNKLSKVLADADLDYLGREDFFIIGLRLHLEWIKVGKVKGLKDWYELQLRFLKEHVYHTQVAHQMRDQQKRKNIEEMESLLNKNNNNH